MRSSKATRGFASGFYGFALRFYGLNLFRVPHSSPGFGKGWAYRPMSIVERPCSDKGTRDRIHLRGAPTVSNACRWICSALALIAITVVALCAPAPVWAWGCEGHEAIALIAEAQLNPRALAAVNKILAENPIDPALSRFCKLEGLDAMANSSTWADDYRRTPEGTIHDVPGLLRAAGCDPIRLPQSLVPHW